MDYSKIMDELEQASLFDLYRLSVAINHQLENPHQIAEIKKRIRIGQTILYFDAVENRLIESKVIKIKRTQLLAENIHNYKQWLIPVYWVNLEQENTDMISSKGIGLDKGQLKVGDVVGFKDNKNNDLYGEIIRLSQKTVTIKTNLNTEWRVGYQWLYLVIDGEQSKPDLAGDQIIEGEVLVGRLAGPRPSAMLHPSQSPFDEYKYT